MNILCSDNKKDNTNDNKSNDNDKHLHIYIFIYMDMNKYVDMERYIYGKVHICAYLLYKYEQSWQYRLHDQLLVRSLDLGKCYPS